jgi:hypothetical protein
MGREEKTMRKFKRFFKRFFVNASYNRNNWQFGAFFSIYSYRGQIEIDFDIFIGPFNAYVGWEK